MKEVYWSRHVEYYGSSPISGLEEHNFIIFMQICTYALPLVMHKCIQVKTIILSLYLDLQILFAKNRNSNSLLVHGM